MLERPFPGEAGRGFWRIRMGTVYIRLTIVLAPEWRWLTVDAASTAPAMPPEMKDTIGGVLDS